MRTKSRIISATVVALALALAVATKADAFDIVNGTDSAIVAVQVKPAGATAWQPEILGENTLGVGKLVKLALPLAPCKYDIMVTLDDGRTITRKDVDVCKAPLIRITDR